MIQKIACFLTICMGVALTNGVAIAQRQGHPRTLPVSSIFICGNDLRLGVAETAILAFFATSQECELGSGNKVDADTSYAVFGRDKSKSYIGNITFSSDRLTSISKNWDVDVKSSMDFASALIGLLAAFEKEGHVVCTIHAGTQTLPEVDTKEAKLDCGAKSVFLGLYKGKDVSNIQISEVLESKS